MQTKTVAEFQATMTDNDADDVQTANPFAGLRIDVAPADAWGFVEGKVRAALTESGRIASEEQIRDETSRLWGPAAHMTVNSGITAITFTTDTGSTRIDSDGAAKILRNIDAIEAGELPGMPEKPAPKMVIRVPSDAEFGDDGEEFFISSPLRARAAVLVDRHPDLFEHLSGNSISVTYLWRRKGGKSRGVPVLGKTIKPTGLLKMFSESHFAIVLAADNCRAYGYQDREIEALLFHHMLRTGVAEVDEETGRGGGTTLVPPDVELFGAEVEVYGLWHHQLRAVAPAFKQAKLWDSARTPSVSEPADNPLSGAGQLIHSDGTPLTDDEVADLEMAESEDL